MPDCASSTNSRYSGRWLDRDGRVRAGPGGRLPVRRAGRRGPRVRVRADGGDPAASPASTLVWFGLRARRAAAEADRITATGMAGTATITGLTQTGMPLNDQPQVDIELLVTIPGRPPYAASRKEFVPLILLGRLRSGGPLPVKVDPNDPEDVIIDCGPGARRAACRPGAARPAAHGRTAPRPDRDARPGPGGVAASGLIRRRVRDPGAGRLRRRPGARPRPRDRDRRDGHHR